MNQVTKTIITAIIFTVAVFVAVIFGFTTFNVFIICIWGYFLSVDIKHTRRYIEVMNQYKASSELYKKELEDTIQKLRNLK